MPRGRRNVVAVSGFVPQILEREVGVLERRLGRSVVVAAGVVAFVAVPVVGAAGAQRVAGAAHHKSACQRLSGHDRAPSSKVKLVTRRNEDDGKDLLGCVLPDGRVRLIASSADYYTSSEGFTVDHVAGAIVLFGTSYSSQYGSGDGTGVVDLRTGESYGIAYECYDIASGYCAAGSENTSATSAYVNKRGQAVAAIVPAGAGAPTTIAGFSRHGTRVDLDSGPSDQVPASSLRLSGTTATWTHGGEQRSAELP
jgi:hypothetical protein